MMSEEQVPPTESSEVAPDGGTEDASTPEAAQQDAPGNAEEASDPEAEVDAGGTVDDALRESSGDDSGFARGEALGPVGASRLAATARTTVVVLAGGPNSGKTTLFAALYERFGLGPVAGHYFLGSRTLHGFDRRCQRIAYGAGPGSGPDGHTAYDAPPWLHLRTARESNPKRVLELLLGDFSGEHFDALIDGTMLPSEFIELRRADHLCLTVDGDLISQAKTQESAVRDSVKLLEVLLDDPKGLASIEAVSFVVTKWDLVHSRDMLHAVEKLHEQLARTLREAGHPDSAIGYLQTAARSTVSAFPIGHGVGDLLSLWTDRPELHVQHPKPEPALVPMSAFDRFES